MKGLMMEWPLVIPSILRRAAQFFAEKEIVSRRGDGSVYRSNYGELQVRVHRLMNVLRGLGVQPGDRIATCAWNHQRHLELYFAIPSLGAILHTINFRLPREQVLYIINHAQDRLIFLDRSLGGILADLERELPTVEKYILMDERGPEPPALPQPVGGLRATDGGRSRACRVSRPGRKHGRGAVLHIGHDRRTQGRALQPPLDFPARDGGLHGGRRRDGREGGRVAGRADVPRQRLGAPLFVYLAGAKQVFPGPW